MKAFLTLAICTFVQFFCFAQDTLSYAEKFSAISKNLNFSCITSDTSSIFVSLEKKDVIKIQQCDSFGFAWSSNIFSRKEVFSPRLEKQNTEVLDLAYSCVEKLHYPEGKYYEYFDSILQKNWLRDSPKFCSVVLPRDPFGIATISTQANSDKIEVVWCDWEERFNYLIFYKSGDIIFKEQKNSQLFFIQRKLWPTAILAFLN